MKKYSSTEFFFNLFCLLITKLMVPSARLMRLPIDIRGKRGIYFGKQLTTGYHCRLETYTKNNKKVLFFGDNVQMNDFVHIAAMNNVQIGNNVLIASKVYISDICHGSYQGNENDSHPDIPPRWRQLISKSVYIGDNVWIGEFVSILPGCSIGKGCIIGSNSVVTKSIPDYSIAVGNPAIVVKTFDFQRQIWVKK